MGLFGTADPEGPGTDAQKAARRARRAPAKMTPEEEALAMMPKSMRYAAARGRALEELRESHEFLSVARDAAAELALKNVASRRDSFLQAEGEASQKKASADAAGRRNSFVKDQGYLGGKGGGGGGGGCSDLATAAKGGRGSGGGGGSKGGGSGGGGGGGGGAESAADMMARASAEHEASAGKAADILNKGGGGASRSPTKKKAPAPAVAAAAAAPAPAPAGDGNSGGSSAPEAAAATVAAAGAAATALANGWNGGKGKGPSFKVPKGSLAGGGTSMVLAAAASSLEAAATAAAGTGAGPPAQPRGILKRKNSMIGMAAGAAGAKGLRAVSNAIIAIRRASNVGLSAVKAKLGGGRGGLGGNVPMLDTGTAAGAAAGRFLAAEMQRKVAVQEERAIADENALTAQKWAEENMSQAEAEAECAACCAPEVLHQARREREAMERDNADTYRRALAVHKELPPRLTWEPPLAVGPILFSVPVVVGDRRRVQLDLRAGVTPKECAAGFCRKYELPFPEGSEARKLLALAEQLLADEFSVNPFVEEKYYTRKPLPKPRPPHRPLAPAAAAHGHSSVRLSWQPPYSQGSRIVEYRVEYKRLEEGEGEDDPETQAAAAKALAVEAARFSTNTLPVGKMVGDGCPNRWNQYHVCCEYCRQRWGETRIDPSLQPVAMRQLEAMGKSTPGGSDAAYDYSSRRGSNTSATSDATSAATGGGGGSVASGGGGSGRKPGYTGARETGNWERYDMRVGPHATEMIVDGLSPHLGGARYALRLRARSAGGWGAAVEMLGRTVPQPPPPEVLTPRGARHRNRRRHMTKWRELQARRRRDGVCLLSNSGGRGIGFFTKVQGHFCIATHRSLVQSEAEAQTTLAIFTDGDARLQVRLKPAYFFLAGGEEKHTDEQADDDGGGGGVGGLPGIARKKHRHHDHHHDHALRKDHSGGGGGGGGAVPKRAKTALDDFEQHAATHDAHMAESASHGGYVLVGCDHMPLLDEGFFPAEIFEVRPAAHE